MNGIDVAAGQEGWPVTNQRDPVRQCPAAQAQPVFHEINIPSRRLTYAQSPRSRQVCYRADLNATPNVSITHKRRISLVLDSLCRGQCAWKLACTCSRNYQGDDVRPVRNEAGSKRYRIEGKYIKETSNRRRFEHTSLWESPAR